jgi:hypothetical protein
MPFFIQKIYIKENGEKEYINMFLIILNLCIFLNLLYGFFI